MFTGIIEELATVEKISKTDLTIQTKLDDIKTGESIAINGVCLTVTNCSGRACSTIVNFQLSAETLQCSNLSELVPGNRVNLERALQANSRLGGHFVTGHVEGVGKIVSVKNQEDSKMYEFSCPEKIMEYIVAKGSVAVDGISLTVVNIKENSFTVALIPHTLKNTTLGFKKKGDTVNLETDILSKYAKKIDEKTQTSRISVGLLKKTGFI